MNYILDLSVLLVIGLTIFFNTKKGFIGSVFDMSRTLLAAVSSYLFGASASAWIAKHWITDHVTDAVYQRLLSLFEAGAERFDLTGLTENLPDWLNAFFKITRIDPNVLLGNLGALTDADSEKLQHAASSLAAPITRVISDFLGYVLVFLLTLLLIRLLQYVLSKLVSLPVLKQLDRTLGFVLGIVMAFVYVSAYTLLLFALMNIVESAYEQVAFHAAFDKTILFQKLYDINLFRWIFGIG